MYNVLFLFIIFASAIETKVPFMNYWDELFTIIVLLLGLYKNNLKLKRSNIESWIWLFVMIVLGLCGNIFYPDLQEDTSTILKDIFAICKIFIIVYSLKNLTIPVDKTEKIVKDCAKLSRMIILLTAGVALIGYFINIGVYTDEIRLVKCFKFVFSVPTFFVSSYVMLATILIAESIKKNSMYLILDCILLFLSQRTKGYAAILLFIVFLLMGEKRLKNFADRVISTKKINVSKTKLALIICLLVVVAFVLGKTKIEQYLFWGTSAARPALYLVGLRIASDFFPVGSGFGTFASSLSTESYSKIYGMYGISGVLGLVQGSASFAADVFWPCIYGQFGIIGFFMYLKNMYGIIKQHLFYTPSVKIRISLFFLWFYALVASTSEAYFSNSSGVQFMALTCLILGANYSRKGYKK